MRTTSCGSPSSLHISWHRLEGRRRGPHPKYWEEMTAATEQGIWVSFVFPNTRSSETLYAHTWAIRHDGLLFTSRYYDDRPDVPDTP